ncbi:MAG TPA: glycosyl hydrolase-related protein, partial [Flexilinea sp.]|nr:glycosyl hydrolase-related protein [Flexilinea sp.]
YVDLSEPAFGFTVVNDCKHGVGVRDGLIGLSLAKGGTRPDERGDVGVYRFRYGFFPHTGGYCAKEVILPAYCFNYPSLPMRGTNISTEPLLTTDAANVIIETIKPCEDSEKAFIARIYESEGSFTSTKLHAGFQIQSLQVCNMMEQPICDCDPNLVFQPFEIKTIKVKY